MATLRQRLGPCRLAVLTGWAMNDGCHYRYGADAAFPISDHADFPELLDFVRQVRPRKVYTLHGYAADFAVHLRDSGFDAEPLSQQDQFHLGLSLPVPTVTRFVSVVPRSGPPGDEGLGAVSEPDAGSFETFAGVCARLLTLQEKAGKAACLAAYLPTLGTDELRPVVTWWMGGCAIGQLPRGGRGVVGWLRRVLSRAAGVQEGEIRRAELCHGSLAEAMDDIWLQRGALAESEALQRLRPVGILEVDRLIREFNSLAGATSREGEWETLFRRCRAMEVRMLLHILLGTLRIGLKPARIAEVVAEVCPGAVEDLIQQGIGGVQEAGRVGRKSGRLPVVELQLDLPGA